jgi:hypothetical protein
VTKPFHIFERFMFIRADGDRAASPEVVTSSCQAGSVAADQVKLILSLGQIGETGGIQASLKGV